MHRRIILLVIIVLISCGYLTETVYAAPEYKDIAQEPGDGPWVVRAYYASSEMVQALASWREPWEINLEDRYIVLDVTRSEYNRLLEAGFRIEIDTELTQQLQTPSQRLPGQTSGIPGYPCYRTVEETYAAAQLIAAQYPTLADWVDIGNSWEKVTPGGNSGYDLMVLRLTNKTIPGPKPTLFIMSSVHAREYTPAELSTRFAEYLVANYGQNADVTWLLDYREIHLLLHANPDGRKQAETGLNWRKNTNTDYCASSPNYRGADLNRNFYFQWGCCGGSSGFECAETYRGASAASEPETQAIQNYVRSIFSDHRDTALSAVAPVTTTGVFLDIHSYGGYVLWPWGFADTVAPNGTALQTLGRKFAYFNNYYPVKASGFYLTDGTTDDFAYGDLGVAAYTFELGTAFFQSCNFFENTILEPNLEALLYAAKITSAPYLLSSGPDALNLTLSPTNTVSAGEAVTLSVTLDDTRYSNRGGTEPVQTIAAAEYYIDTAPGIAGTMIVSHALSPVDGDFDSSVEFANITLDTTHLDTGRHMVFIRGQDTAGHWGPFSALFLEITDTKAALEIMHLESSAPVFVSETVYFSATVSGATPLTYIWEFGDSAREEQGLYLENITHTYTAANTYTVTLTVTGADQSLTDTQSITITVREPILECQPVGGVDFTYSPPVPKVGGMVTFTGQTLEGTLPVTYTWAFVQNGTATGITATHSYSESGTYVVEMTATNSCPSHATVRHLLVVPPVEGEGIPIYLPLVLRG